MIDNFINKAITEKISLSSAKSILKHTKFEMFDEIIYSQKEQFGSSGNVIIERLGDLIAQVSFFVDLPPNENFVNDIEFAVIKRIYLEIGGSTIHDLTNDQIFMYSKTKKISGKNKKGFFITIPFFINKTCNTYNTGNALPLIALMYHNVRIKFEYEKLQNLVKNSVVNNINSTFDVKIMVKYINLSNSERNLFMYSKHEYLLSLDQHIYNTIETNTYKLSLKYIINFSVKNFKFAFRGDTTDVYFNYLPICKNIDFVVNDIHIYQKCGEVMIDENNIYTYNFEILDKSPSGTLNFSTINDGYLSLSLDKIKCTMVFSAEHFNILQILSGLEALKFSI